MKKINKKHNIVLNLNFKEPKLDRKQNPQNILRNTVKELYNQKNWDGLRKYLLLLDEKKMLPKSYKWQVAQCFINQNKLQESLDFLYKLHWKDPLQPEIQLTILDALAGLGKSEYSFQWLKKPVLHHVEFEFIQKSYKLLTHSRGSMILFILYSELASEKKVMFDEFDLLYYLKKDSRFHIFNDTCYFRYSRISLNAKPVKMVA